MLLQLHLAAEDRVEVAEAERKRHATIISWFVAHVLLAQMRADLRD